MINEILLAPLLLNVTSPVKLLLPLAKVIEFPPAVKLAEPGTITGPACVIAPPAVTAILPPLVNVNPGNPMAALL